MERVRLLLRPALRTALHSVRPANLRLEYKDSFRYVGQGEPLAETLLNSNSDLIASHVFQRTKLWHSHTGFFEEASGCSARLVQVNLDANDAIDAMRPQSPPFRMVAITTGVQNNFDGQGPELIDNEDELATSLVSMFDSLHERAIELFKNVIHPSVAARVGL